MIRGLATLFAAATLGFAQPAHMVTAEEMTALEAKVASGQASREEEKLLGSNYAFAVDGVTAINDNGVPIAMDKSLRTGPAAARARKALLASKRAAVIGPAGQLLWVGCCAWPSWARRQFAEQLIHRAIELEPQEGEWRIVRILNTEFAIVNGRPKLKPGEAFRLMEADLAVLRGEDRVSALRSMAKTAFQANELAKAEEWGEEMLRAARQDEGAPYYGDAIFYGHMVLGQVALRRSEIESARMHLIESAHTPGSPTLNSFGPNTSLARDVLRVGERDVVIEFLELSKEFWKSPYRDADEWIRTIRAGRTPNWRASVYY